jgi:hypothetical protein
MTNRLVDLESTIVRSHKKKLAAHRNGRRVAHARKPQGALTRVATAPPPAAAPSLSPAPAVAKGLSALVSRWPARAASKAHAFGAVNYTVNGVFGPLAQPSPNACWATVFTMLMSWRRQQSLTNETSLGGDVKKWVDKNSSYTALLGSDKPAFITAAGLVAEPPQSYSVEGWENLLRNYGPIWVTTDEQPGKGWSIHARVITAISGDGTPEQTFFTIVDPAGGRTYQESIAVFIPKYEEEVIQTGYMRIQVVHWSADARAEVRAQSFSGRTVRPARRARTRAMAAPVVVPIASAIGGAVMTRILSNTGDISFELEQLQGLKHIGNNSANEGTTPYQNQTITINGPHSWLGGGIDHIYADTEITFQYHGHSLGNVQIANVRSNDALGAGLVVKATIMDEANAFTKPPSTERFAAIKVRIHYRFTFTFGDDYIGIDDLVLYGDGTYARSLRWTQ